MKLRSILNVDSTKTMVKSRFLYILVAILNLYQTTGDSLINSLPHSDSIKAIVAIAVYFCYILLRIGVSLIMDIILNTMKEVYIKIKK